MRRRHPGRYLLSKRAPDKASAEYLSLLTWLPQRNLQLSSGKLRSRVKGTPRAKRMTVIHVPDASPHAKQIIEIMINYDLYLYINATGAVHGAGS
jgi:hypothetical protein